MILRHVASIVVFALGTVGCVANAGEASDLASLRHLTANLRLQPSQSEPAPSTYAHVWELKLLRIQTRVAQRLGAGPGIDATITGTIRLQ